MDPPEVVQGAKMWHVPFDAPVGRSALVQVDDEARLIPNRPSSRGTLCVVDPRSTGASGRRIRVLGILVGACLLVIAAALAILPMTVEVVGSTAECGVPAFALRAPSEPDDKGFNAVDDACSGAGFERMFKAFVFGGAGVAGIIGAQRICRGRS